MIAIEAIRLLVDVESRTVFGDVKIPWKIEVGPDPSREYHVRIAIKLQRIYGPVFGAMVSIPHDHFYESGTSPIWVVRANLYHLRQMIRRDFEC